MELIESIKGKTHKEAQVALAEINPVAVLPSNKEKPLSKSHSHLQIVVDQETMSLLKQIQELLSHTIPDGDYNSILKYMGKHMTEILRKKKGLRSGNPKKIKSETINKCDITGAIAEESAREDAGAGVGVDANTSTEIGVSVNMSSKVEFNNFEKSPQYDSELPISTISDVSITGEYVTGNKQNNSGNHKIKINETTDASKRSVQSRYMPRNVKRVIFERSGGRCEFIGMDGHRCYSHHQLEIDHVIPWSFGGENNEQNCRLLCRSHNNFRTKETHGFWFKTSGQNNKKSAM